MGQRTVYYAAVAGDIRGTYLRWRDGLRDERQLAATYSGQFFDLCTRLDRKGVASFPSDAEVLIRDAEFEIRSLPLKASASGLRFHWGQLRSAWRLWLDVWRTGARDVIVMDGVTSFYLLIPLALSGCRVFLSIHTVLWKKGEKRNIAGRLVDRLNGWFFRNYCAGCLAASGVIKSQVCSLSKNKTAIRTFNPLYRREDFDCFQPPPIRTSEPFRVIYMGRIEANKGVLDLLSAVHALIADGYLLTVDFCGDGGDLKRLQQAIDSCHLDQAAFTHGHLSRSELTSHLEMADVVVVPTRSEFPEGLNQVVIEAMLARRPVITSNVCPALELVAPAALEAQPDDVASYKCCISKLMEEPHLTAQLVLAGSALRDQFFDESLAWTAQAFELLQARKDSG